MALCLGIGTRRLSSIARLVPAVRPFMAAAAKSSGEFPAPKKLFTPGPLGVTMRVKEAMLRDLGSRDVVFIQTVKEIRSGLLELASVSAEQFVCVPVQGSGTFAVEAAIQTGVPRGGRLLVVSNGAYGDRIGNIAKYLDIDTEIVRFDETEMYDLGRLEQTLKGQKFSNVAAVHCETSSGMINVVEDLGRLVHKHQPECTYFVDAMSSFGAVPLDMVGGNINFMVSSANKCIQGVPGFSYVLADRQKLAACKGNSRSLCFDLVEQNAGLDANGQFRFTPATHSMLAFREALRELEEEGGVDARRARYMENRRVLRTGMSELGFKELLREDISGYIITSYHYPTHPNFSFEEFYSRLNARDLVIYPGKTTKANCFRIGTIGDLHPEDMAMLLQSVREVLDEMKVPVPVQY